MKKFLPLLLCLLLSMFTMARATKSAHAPAPDTRRAQKNPTGQEADGKTLFDDENTDQQKATDDEDSMAGENEGETVNDDDGGNAQGDQETGDNDAGDEDGGDDGGGDEAK
jgi:hypothetical protein